MSEEKQKFTGFTFNAGEVAPQGILEQLPDGKYPFTITDGEVKPLDNGGERVTFEFTVMEGHPLAGRRFWDGFNTSNPNSPTNERISRAQVSGIFHAIAPHRGGSLVCEDISELFGLPLIAKVASEERNAVNANGEKCAFDDPEAVKKFEGKNAFKGAEVYTEEKAAALLTAPEKPVAGAAKWKKPAKPETAAPTPSKPAPASKPAATPTPSAPKPPTKPTPPKPPVKKQDDRKFFLYLTDDDMPTLTAKEVSDGLASGDLTAESALLWDGEPEGTGWKTAADYGLVATVEEAAAPEPVKTGPKLPPKPPAKPTPSAAPAAEIPAATGGTPTKTAPWKRAKA